MRRELVNNKPCTAPVLEQQVYSSIWDPVDLGFTVPGDTLRKTSVGREQTNGPRPWERAVVEFLPCHSGFLAGCAAVAVIHRADPLPSCLRAAALPPPIQSNPVTPWLGIGKGLPCQEWDLLNEKAQVSPGSSWKVPVVCWAQVEIC